MITLSIGIPTYERLNLLERSIKSIIDQNGIEKYEIEILIGDDSKTSNYSFLKEIELSFPKNITLEYSHHQPSKGQNANVASLINRAKGTYFCLMHDDDFFLQDALNILLKKVIENNHCIVFGKQLIYNKNFDYSGSDKVNDDFKRSTEFEGKQKDSIALAMLQQCPNDGYILQSQLAKSIGSRLESEIGTACDFDFALRATVQYNLSFYFVNQYTTAYNISDDSVTSSFQNNAGERKLKILYEFNTNKTHSNTFHEVLKTDLSMVISHYIIVKNYKEAKKYLFSVSNYINYLWYKPVTYLQVCKILFKF